jgi:FlaA1/EpsC-like NDP-sugar epimerase
LDRKYKSKKGKAELTLITLMRYRIWLVLGFQLIVALVAYASAILLRFELELPKDLLPIFIAALPLHLIWRLATSHYYRVHTSSWRFASVQDLIGIIKATVAGSLGFIVTLVFVSRLAGFPRSVLIIEPLLNVILSGGARLLVRHHHQSRERENTKRHKRQKHVLIVGAGKAAFLLLKEIHSNSQLGIHVVGCVDDDPYKKKTSILGVPVLGVTDEIPQLVSRLGIDEIIVAIPSADYKEIVRIKTIAESTPAKTLILPGLSELISDQKFVSQLRDVSCEELLGRGVIKFCRDSDRKGLESEIQGKAVLVTGAGGSIGSELCRQVAQFNPAVLVLYERYESGLYEIELDLKREYPDLRVLPVLGDILDQEKLGRVIRENDIDLIYHAAAYKHVPMMEREPLEAVRNNVFGTLNTAKLACKCGVEKFVLISTDKAVRPCNVMGTTKRVAEMIVEGLLGHCTRFTAVRFGNVLGSNGSVIPLFKKQIAAGGPVTVTHPEATRYFMSISEAVQLVMIAGSMARGGEVFLLDMGEPVKILDLAKNLIRFSGLEPDKDIDIVFTGLRSGEKLHEELYWQGEGIVSTDNRKITVWKSDGLEKDLLFDQIKKLDEYVKERNLEGIVSILCQIVPEAKLAAPQMGPVPQSSAARAVNERPTGDGEDRNAPVKESVLKGKVVSITGQ